MTDYRIEVRITDGSADPVIVTDQTLTYTQRHDRKVTVQNTSAILYDSNADGAVADFDVLVLYADQPVEVELTINDGDANEELVHLTLAKNVPLLLGDDAARYNHSASDAFAGTLDVIDRVRVQEINNVSATVTLVLLT